ncbi:MAG: hypothetical protein R2779_06140 [Crocinitomicaceae bacterium]
MKTIIAIVALALSYSAFAQNIDFKAANFKDDKEGLKKATDAIKTGDELLNWQMRHCLQLKSPGLNFKSVNSIPSCSKIQCTKCTQ